MVQYGFIIIIITIMAIMTLLFMSFLSLICCVRNKRNIDDILALTKKSTKSRRMLGKLLSRSERP